MYLLFDCNNFFASCEQVFRPDRRHRPLVVLSNNDGCVVSRSPEAKALGIAMGEPYFRCRERLTRADAVVCSANFALYGNLSDRIMQILEESLPEVHQYSIDEAFACVKGDFQDWQAFSRRIRSRIRRWTGITVSVGIAPTKTLAKLANETAKSHPEYGGVMILEENTLQSGFLTRIPVEDVWGVGRRLAPRMHAHGIRTAAGLAASDSAWLRRLFGVHGERLALELRGISCLEDEPVGERTQVMVSRTLKEGIADFDLLRGAVCDYMERAAQTLRTHELMAAQVHVVLRTSRHVEDVRQYAAQQGVRLDFPSDDTVVFTRVATELLKQIFQPGYQYRKVGVLLAELQPRTAVHPTFDHPVVKANPLMKVLDELTKDGHHVQFAGAVHRPLSARSHVSPSYTGRWAEIPEAR